MKFCFKCRKTKTIDDFHKNNRSKDKLQYFCIECQQKSWESRASLLREQDELQPERRDARLQQYLYMLAKKRAKKLGVEFTIKKEDIKIVHVCPIIGVQMERHQQRLDRNSYSVDRVDNSKGYVPGNVRVISWFANQTKNNLTKEQVEKLYEYMKG